MTDRSRMLKEIEEVLEQAQVQGFLGCRGDE